MTMADWPLFGIRLACRTVTLRPVREDDLPQLAGALPGDVGHDPRLELFDEQSAAQNERRLFCQGYWRALGTWSPSSWVLHLAVRHAGELVGVQTVEGDNFAVLRTVDTASWLVPPARGRGLGVAMRMAALGLAFDHLGALAAVSSAVVTNAASLGVSRRLGYADNGLGFVAETTGRAELRHVRLTAEAWQATGYGREVTVSGVDACRRWFGV
ncbi:RimJ/RimL family protein N-acetyltransferase [Krasilnikovia cinnamomea]|uniref:RimJ/RimL family protein N-acetyltransferase n=1 Tax=Krasilnikovia cinnamomea TaxID=349313 RepID=A0A4Q7ZCP9_9ACTN|nr:GNAT family protein [Krasilnikovia cinnamomea]RZU48442.1 RimJ/RimL family protein N-acetyltransferase [Krasilnikovia cinnamomea]